MSSTRRAVDNSVFHQSRYASSVEFERGLMGNLVAKRCALIDNAAKRELIWFIQYLSHNEGGISALAKDLISKYPDKLQTPAMIKFGMKPGKICNASLVKLIRAEIDSPYNEGFLLKGENDTVDIMLSDDRYCSDEDESAALMRLGKSALSLEQKANAYPSNYPAETFIELCIEAAENNLEKYLCELCLDPSKPVDSGPWYFPDLIATLGEYKTNFVKAKSAGVVTTNLGEKVCEVLNYTAYGRGLTLMQGEARMGKSFAARKWCEQHPGQARFVEVPPSNDDATFFRALARGLGLGNFLKYKVAEIRERVESVLLTGDLLLVLDEAHRLWPQMNIRYGFPSRINWLMAMANHNVPICCISTPQFIEWQKAAEVKGQWNSAQLTGRISHFESLPPQLSVEDLTSVARSVLPEASDKVLQVLAIYAQSSARYLAAIDSISKRARFIAMKSGRDKASTDDVRKAMKESVIPADTKLQRALDSGRKGRLSKMQATDSPLTAEYPTPEIEPQAGRGMPQKAETEEILPAGSRLPAPVLVPRNRAGNGVSLVEA